MHRLLGDNDLGGGNTEGHAKVVALHLFKLFKSTTVFTEVMKTLAFTEKIECLKYFRSQQLLQVHVYVTVCELQQVHIYVGIHCQANYGSDLMLHHVSQERTKI